MPKGGNADYTLLINGRLMQNYIVAMTSATREIKHVSSSVLRLSVLPPVLDDCQLTWSTICNFSDHCSQMRILETAIGRLIEFDQKILTRKTSSNPPWRLKHPKLCQWQSSHLLAASMSRSDQPFLSSLDLQRKKPRIIPTERKISSHKPEAWMAWWPPNSPHLTLLVESPNITYRVR